MFCNLQKIGKKMLYIKYQFSQTNTMEISIQYSVGPAIYCKLKNGLKF